MYLDEEGNTGEAFVVAGALEAGWPGVIPRLPTLKEPEEGG